MLTPTLITERLTLRATCLEDFEPCVAMWGDEAVVRHIGGQVSSRSETWMRLLRMPGLWALLGYGYWSVIETRTGRFVGQAGLADFKREVEPTIEGIPEVGYGFIPEVHGRGYATEAMRAVVGWADQNVDAPRHCALIDFENQPSFRVAEKLGFDVREPATLNGASTCLLWRERGAGSQSSEPAFRIET